MSLQALSPATSISWAIETAQNGFATLITKVRQIVVERLATPGGIAAMTVGSAVLLAALARRFLQPAPRVDLGGYLKYNYKEVIRSEKIKRPEDAQIIVVASKKGDQALNERLMAEWEINKGQVIKYDYNYNKKSVKSIINPLQKRQEELRVEKKEIKKRLEEGKANQDELDEVGLKLINNWNALEKAKKVFMSWVLEAVKNIDSEIKTRNLTGTFFLVYNDLNTEILEDENVMNNKPLNEYSVVVLTPKIERIDSVQKW